MDVGVYGPYQQHYGRAFDDFFIASYGLIRVTKANFYSLLRQAREKTFVSRTIASAWEKAGIYPFNRDVILAKLSVQETEDKSSVTQVDAQLQGESEDALLAKAPSNVEEARQFLTYVAHARIVSSPCRTTRYSQCLPPFSTIQEYADFSECT